MPPPTEGGVVLLMGGATAHLQGAQHGPMIQRVEEGGAMSAQPAEQPPCCSPVPLINQTCTSSAAICRCACMLPWQYDDIAGLQLRHHARRNSACSMVYAHTKHIATVLSSAVRWQEQCGRAACCAKAGCRVWRRSVGTAEGTVCGQAARTFYLWTIALSQLQANRRSPMRRNVLFLQPCS